MSEFSGERVIPGQVNDDLWAEHISRYAFAERFAPGRRVLDLGCGTGYGTSALAKATNATVTGLDLAAEALDHAAAHYPECRYVRGSASQLPFHDDAFDLITAFEVIEHLADWRHLLQEARRVLHPGGVLLVSTPNRLYYAESRAEHGPNPFHRHEFEYAEFQQALSEYFPRVRLYLQNRLEAVAFYAPDRYLTAEAQINQNSGTPSEANFFIGVCSIDAAHEAPALIYVPKAVNLLREREHHIRLLERELKQNHTWIREQTADRDRLLDLHSRLEKEFDHRGNWAAELQTLLETAQQRIAQLQRETEDLTQGYEKHICALEAENAAKTQWALETEQRLSTALEAQSQELARTAGLLHDAEATVDERTRWAQSLDTQLAERQTQLAMVRQSRWLKLGRKLNLGPPLEHPET